MIIIVFIIENNLMDFDKCEIGYKLKYEICNKCKDNFCLNCNYNESNEYN